MSTETRIGPAPTGPTPTTTTSTHSVTDSLSWTPGSGIRARQDAARRLPLIECGCGRGHRDPLLCNWPLPETASSGEPETRRAIIALGARTGMQAWEVRLLIHDSLTASELAQLRLRGGDALLAPRHLELAEHPYLHVHTSRQRLFSSAQFLSRHGGPV